MFSPALSERLDVLIDDLILDGGVEAASLASILLAAKESVKRNYHVSLTRWVWSATNEIATELDESPTPASAPSRYADVEPILSRL